MRWRAGCEGVGVVTILGKVRGVVEDARFSSINAAANGQERKKTRLATAQEHQAGLRR